MVAIKVDADARVQGTADQERYPIVAKIKGTGKDGGLSVSVAGDAATPVSAKISGDSSSPIAIAPVSVSIPDLSDLTKSLDIAGLVEAISKMAGGLKVDVASVSGVPVSVSLGSIPVDLSISVFSPTEDRVFRVEIKGSIGSK